MTRVVGRGSELGITRSSGEVFSDFRTYLTTNSEYSQSLKVISTVQFQFNAVRTLRVIMSFRGDRFEEGCVHVK